MASYQLYLGDCIDFMKTLDAGSVDAVITDPPYGIGFEYASGKEFANDPSGYWLWYSKYHAECMRVLRPGGFWAVFQSGTYHRYLWDWFGDDTRIYIAAKNFVQLRPTQINHAYDPVAMGYKSGNPLTPKSPARNLDYSVADTASLVSNPSRPERQHPTPKTVGQLKHIVGNFVIDCGVVFDPFMGSGTTGVACMQLGRNFIGCEIDPGYYAIAEKRISEAAMQPQLPGMDAPKIEATQEAFV